MAISATPHEHGTLLLFANLFTYNDIYIFSTKLHLFHITTKEIHLFLLTSTKYTTKLLIYIIFYRTKHLPQAIFCHKLRFNVYTYIYEYHFQI